MRFTCRLVCCALAAMVATAGPALGAEVPCGQPPADGGEPARATLTLDPTLTQNNPLNFNGSTRDRSFRLLYRVSGCALAEAPNLRARISADRDVADAIDRPTVDAEGSLVEIDVNVHPTFPTGSATSLLTIGGSDVVPLAQPLTMQRKEPPLWPTVITFGAGLLGVVGAIITTYVGVADRRKRGESIVWRPLHGIVAFGAGVGATVAVYQSSYVRPETFTLEVPSGLVLAVAAFAAAVGGAKTGAGGTVALARSNAARREQEAVAAS
jgi:hypothetical protein